jgi:hypothetical protein
MAHTCPQCGCYCTCKGDWDDIDLGHEPPGGCVHYLDPDCDCNHDGEEDYDADYEEWLPQDADESSES